MYSDPRLNGEVVAQNYSVEGGKVLYQPKFSYCLS